MESKSVKILQKQTTTAGHQSHLITTCKRHIFTATLLPNQRRLLLLWRQKTNDSHGSWVISWEPFQSTCKSLHMFVNLVHTWHLTLIKYFWYSQALLLNMSHTNHSTRWCDWFQWDIVLPRLTWWFGRAPTHTHSVSVREMRCHGNQPWKVQRYKKGRHFWLLLLNNYLQKLPDWSQFSPFLLFLAFFEHQKIYIYM